MTLQVSISGRAQGAYRIFQNVQLDLLNVPCCAISGFYKMVLESR